jgi:ABC-2 type transport system permease protein
MFHVFKYRLTCILRDKQNVFWTLIFPILLSVLFNFAFSNLSAAENFTKIKIGIVENEELRDNPAFVEVIDAVPDILDPVYATETEAEKLLEEGQLKGYVHFNDGLNLIVKESGIYQTIVKSLLDDFIQTTSTIKTIIDENPNAIEEGLVESVSERINYLEAVSVSESEPNTVVNYFYALIAMACLYGSFSGLKEVTALQGNLSYQGARMNMTPVHKAKMILASIGAAIVFQLAVISALILFLIFVLKIDFGNQIGYIALTSVVSTITGVTFGTFVSSINRKSEGVKVGILIGTSMLMSSLSGMMYDKMKYIINSKVPVLGYLNPANLITDSFYALYYYDTHSRFFLNIALLCGYSFLFGAITYLSLRRQRYASI